MAVPPNPELGDVAFPCFTLAKQFRKAPAGHCRRASEKSIRIPCVRRSIFAYGSRRGIFEFLPEARCPGKKRRYGGSCKGGDYGKTEEGKGKRVLVEFSSPNIAKPFHIGHLVTTALGSAIERIYAFLGYDTVKINHIGDWGTQFGKLISAYKRWGDGEASKKIPSTNF